MLLAVPLFIASFFVILVAIAVVILILDRRRYRARFREFRDDNDDNVID